MLQGLGSEERPMYRHCTTAQYKKKPVVLHTTVLAGYNQVSGANMLHARKENKA